MLWFAVRGCPCPDYLAGVDTAGDSSWWHKELDRRMVGFLGPALPGPKGQVLASPRSSPPVGGSAVASARPVDAAVPQGSSP